MHSEESESASEYESEDSEHVILQKTRPPSSLSTRSLRPHPLIRGPSTTTTITTPADLSSPLPPLTVTDVDVVSPSTSNRRFSFSSVHPRTRTLSTLSTTSSAALSSLAQFPAATRPPSPAPLAPHLNPSHTISFFPPTNPHANIELIHPLLPHPYLGNHLTVLARRVPMREALDRVRLGRAKWDKAS